MCTYVLWETGLVCGPNVYHNISHILHFTYTAQLSKALGVGRGEQTQTWQLPSIAVDGPFGTASEVRSHCNKQFVFYYLSFQLKHFIWIIGNM